MSSAATTVSASPGPKGIHAAGRRLVRAALSRLERGAVVLDDGIETSRFGDPSADPVRVRVHAGSFYTSVLLGGTLGASESYMDGDWDCDDLAGLFRFLLENRSSLDSMGSTLATLSAPVMRLAYTLQRNSRHGSKRNIAAHYDLSNEFFALWLDPTMTYSSGYFATPDTSLEQAQREKLDRACRKLDLSQSDHLLEIGTGWGSAAIHAAQHYGCRVSTTTISENQHSYAAARIKELGLGDRITLLKQDYRDLSGSYDKLISIEMIEAVGRGYLPSYFETVSRLLKPEGLALIQAITIREKHWARAAKTRDFLKKYIFPGSCLLSLSAMGDAMAQRSDLHVLDLEDMGPHYAQTLRRWNTTFHDRLEDVRALGFDDRFTRMWRYYFEYCEGAFEARHCSVSQLLLDKPLARRTLVPDRSAP